MSLDPKLLLRDLLATRSIKVTVGRFTFTFTRPDEMELIRMAGGKAEARIDLIILQTLCKGWEGVLESDVVHGGASDQAIFDTDLWRAWIAERNDLWDEISEKIAAAIIAKREQVKALSGN